MPDKIFYSWQSDRPNKTNRSFIEDALKKAIRNLGQAENEIYNSPRPELDKDTKGVAGSPPIADTIFKKIEECAVFVPDLTFCAETEKGRLSPNPNVLIEYGWALAKLGHAKIVGVMNSAYGKPTSETVPFNMRHLRWPYHFALEENLGAENRQTIKKDLVKFFEKELDAALKASPIAGTSFPQLQPKARVSSFLDDGDTLGILPAGSGTVVWRDGPQLFLRVIPGYPIGLYTPLDIKEMLEKQLLRPFRSGRPGRSMGNEWGGVAFAPERTEETDQLSPDYIVQVTRQGEIWGIDNYDLQPVHIAREAEWASSAGFPKDRLRGNVVPFFEDDYARALTQYLQFAREQLRVQSTVTVIAGLTGVQGFQILLPDPPQGHTYTSFTNRVGNAAQADIVFTIRDVLLEPEGEVEIECHEGYPLDRDVHFRHAYKTLIPFFDYAWKEFQQKRPNHLPK